MMPARQLVAQGKTAGLSLFLCFFVETVDTLVLIWHYYVFGSASSQTSFKSMFSFNLNMLMPDAGWSSLAARRAHNPKVTGSNPVPATKKFCSKIQLILMSKY